MKKASILTIGDELLIGQVIDTNSAWMAQQLNKVGIPVIRRVAVGDSWEEIWQALEEESKHASIILITGGLGPTADDITKPLLCEYFGGRMIVDKAALANVQYIFEKLIQRPMLAINLKQAEVPDVCAVIQNKLGTAPGMWFEKDGVIFVSMPGVPFEMQGMMQGYVLPELSHRFQLPFIAHRTLLTAGIGESYLSEMIHGFEAELPATIKLAYLPSYGMVRLRLSSSGEDKAVVEKELQQQFDLLQSLVKEWMVTNEDEPLEKAVGQLLMAKKKTLSTAESCTGGYIAHLLTSIPGSSAFYNAGIISYSYQAKEDLLEVAHDVLEEEGAVCEEVVLQMAKGALKRMQTDYTIAVSGIMGPGGGSTNKPVGTVWIAVGNKEKVVAKQFLFRFDRMRNIQLTANNALNILRIFINENGS